MSTNEVIESAIETRRKRPLGGVPWKLARFARRKPVGFFAGVVLVVALISGVFAPIVATEPYNKPNLRDKLQGPTLKHWMGTDQLGRDLYSRVVWGARVSVIVGVSVILLATTLSLVLGGVAGHVGGWYDLIVLRLVDAWLTFPTLVIALTLVAVFGQNVQNIIAVLSLAMGFQFSRITRSAVLTIKNQQYMEAARAVGCSGPRIFILYVLPNISPIVIVLATAAMGNVILAEASLSFLGFGVPPPQPTWGGLLTGTAVNYMTTNFWLAVWPGLALSLVVFSSNMLGDALRDVLDPRLRGT